jgi:hypothetical protein
MSSLVDLIGTSLLGVGTGGIGTLFQSIFGGISTWIGEWQKRKTAALLHQQDLERADKEIQMMQVETDGRIQEAREERASREVEVAAESYQASLHHDRATYSAGKTTWADFLLTITDFIRGITRPVMTAFLCYVSWRTYVHFTQYMTANRILLESEQAGEITTYVVHNVIFMASTAVGWWFSSRSPKGQVKK